MQKMNNQIGKTVSANIRNVREKKTLPRIIWRLNSLYHKMHTAK